MNARPQDIYARTQVNTAHPGELTLMLYNGCLKFMKQAREHLENKNIEARNTNIKRALDIIEELQATLNMQYDISRNLFSLYAFIKDKLIEANMRMSKESIQIAYDMTEELRDTWAQALKQVKTQGAK
ncbi:flagellar protein FliS [Paenibacillus taihuensis]|uniref:Flagellar secretion chaperone FliS n=1 Tax=Paenibacillus taihuensis TaxID=1156355 RepID=A0A3D9RXE0_9BACL|nr:flagellar export chaperone FliS [Paenibacillus taihuensis]REE84487.1 flagellar protein FliS [Paenibacillus taihuensis]